MAEVFKVPKVFISYAWSSESHKKWVLDLAEKLTSDSGLNVILDRWHAKVGHDRFHFMENSIREADKVLIICDKKYCDKANNREGGVGTESMIITPNIYSETRQEKFLPIALEIENGEFVLPDFFKSRFALDMTKIEKFESAYLDLEKLLWEEPLLNPPTRGSRPSFNSEIIAEKLESEKLPVFNDEDIERVMWLLPRGFLIFRDITFQKNNSWAVVADYYDYTGMWKHGTHYHTSYSSRWYNNLEVQYNKLSIPKSDWLWCVGALNFLMELRDTDKVINISNRVEEERRVGYPVFYFNRKEPMYLPTVPKELRYLFNSSSLRDIIEELNYCIQNKLQEEELIEKAIRIKHSTFLECESFFGKDHSSIKFIQEVLEELKRPYDTEKILKWFSNLKVIISNSLNHEYNKMIETKE